MRYRHTNAATTSVIADALHGRIIPNLLSRKLSGKVFDVGGMSSLGSDKVETAQVENFVRLLIEGTDEDVFQKFDALYESGVSAASLYLELLSDAAALLGEQWCDDTVSFGDVTLGLATLHRLLHHNAHLLEAELEQLPDDKSVFLTPLPDQSHLFGAAIVEAFFRGGGWRVRSGIKEDVGAILQIVSQEHFDVIGISLASADDIDACRQFVSKLRKSSRNKNVVLMVGGRPLSEDPALVQSLSADGTAVNAKLALEVARALCNQGAGSGTRK